MKLTIVIPCYNSEATISEVIDLTTDYLNKLDEVTFNFVLVNDGSQDRTYHKIKELSKKYSNVIGINLTKNSGQHNAILAGLSITDSEYYLGMDDDMQTHPSQISKLLDKILEGFDVVYGKYTNTISKGIKRITSNLHNYSVEKLIGKPKGLKATSFWIMKKNIRDQIIRYPSQFTDLQSLFLRTTGSITNVEIEHFKRMVGTSNYSFKKSLKLWSSLLNFSVMPFHYMMMFSVVFMLLFIIAIPFLGWGICFIAMCTGMLLFAISILGIYVARLMLIETNTPQYTIAERTDMDIDMK